MTVENVSDVDRLKRINEALIERVERSMDQQGNAFTLFQTAINLEGRVRARTDEMKQIMRRLEQSNRDLSVAKVAAETANASKTRFIAAASHDVLQPLNAARLSISGLSELLVDGEGAGLVRQVERSLDRRAASHASRYFPPRFRRDAAGSHRVSASGCLRCVSVRFYATRRKSRIKATPASDKAPCPV